jgi:hypothetical protein
VIENKKVLKSLFKESFKSMFWHRKHYFLYLKG